MKEKEETVDTGQQSWTQPLLTKHEQLQALTGKSAELSLPDDPDGGNRGHKRHHKKHHKHDD